MEVDEPAGPRPSSEQQEQQQAATAPEPATAQQQPNQNQKQVLLLLKGHPATGKSALARRLATTLRWPVVDKDDARDCLEASLMPVPSSGNGGGNGNAGPTSSGGGGVAPTNPPPASPQPNQTSSSSAVVVAPRVLNDLSYDIMFRVAASQLSCGLSVIVDCPLARRELYERAAALARPSSAAVVVVECLPASEEAWREALDTRVANAALEPAAPGGAARPGSARHKPRSWEALQQLVRAYGDASEWTRSPAPCPPAVIGGGGGAEGGGLASPRTMGSAPSSAAPPVVPHYLSVRTLRRGANGGGNGGTGVSSSSSSAAADAATRAAADEVVTLLRRRGLCSAVEGAAAADAGGAAGDAATEAVEIPVQGAHMEPIAE
jgi:predicted kinase